VPLALNILIARTEGWLATAAVTNAVLAACVVLVAGAAVGTVGVPVKAGDARGARDVSLG
jgi:hypothetical protein